MSVRKPARPFVTTNFALTWDGKVTTRKHTPSDFSSPRDKYRLQEIRSTADGILAGVRTIAADNMSMGLPAPELRAQRVAGGRSEYPIRILVSNSGRISPALRVFQTGFSPVLVFSTTRMGARTRAALEARATVHLNEGATVDLPAMMAVLGTRYGIKRLACEGGPTLFRSLVLAGLVDEVHLTLCPRIFGGRNAPTLTGLAREFLPASVGLELRAMEVIGDECFLRYRVKP